MLRQYTIKVLDGHLRINNTVLKKILCPTILLGFIGSLFGFYLSKIGHSFTTLEFWILMIFEGVFILSGVFTGWYYDKNL